jgi:hypothetical protein
MLRVENEDTDSRSNKETDEASRGGVFSDISRFRATETALSRVTGGKATESQRLFQRREKIGIAQDCVVEAAFRMDRSPTAIAQEQGKFCIFW